MKDKWSKENLQEIVNSCYYQKEVLLNLGLRAGGNNGNTLKKYLKKYNINTDHFKSNYEKIIEISRSNKIDLDDILKENSDYNRGHLKERLYKEGLKIRECELCGQNEIWMGKRMSLILDHINGTHNDNRIQNLRIVCPNCNSTLPTHCGRNKSKNKLEKIETISKLIKEISNKSENEIFLKYGESYTVKKSIEDIKKLDILKNSDIDFSKFGWVSKAAKIIGIKDQAVNKWLKRMDPEFYKECFSRK